MSDTGEIVNKVAQSGIITLDLAELRPRGARVEMDIAEQLWQGIALREKDFRTWVKDYDWSSLQDAHLAVYCSVDAIIPSWAYMLIASHAEPYVATLVYGNLTALEAQLFREAIATMEVSEYENQRIMLKGCGAEVPTSAYLELSARLRPVVKSLMFGEPCSAVPVYKARR